MTDRALIEGDDTPAHVPGYGPVPAGLARGLVARRSGRGSEHRSRRGRRPNRGQGRRDPAESGPPEEVQVWLRRLFTHPSTGTLVAMDSGRRLFPAGLRRFVVRARRHPPHAVVRCRHRSRGSRRPVRRGRRDERSQRPGAVRVLQPPQGGPPAGSQRWCTRGRSCETARPASSGTLGRRSRRVEAPLDRLPHTVRITTPTGSLLPVDSTACPAGHPTDRARTCGPPKTRCPADRTDEQRHTTRAVPAARRGGRAR